MTAVLDPPAAQPADRSSPDCRPQPGGRAVLRGVTWPEYVTHRERPENSSLKMTYDGPRGLLEIEMPQGLLHESVADLIRSLIKAFALVRQIDLQGTGEVTLAGERVDRGLEGDASFYITNAAAVAGRERLDLDAGDPPPDLSVEVDVTSPGVAKLPIYAAIGVPEVWVWDARDGSLTARTLGEDGEYRVVTRSAELPGFPLKLAEDLIRRRGGLKYWELIAEFNAGLPPAPDA